MASNPDYDPYAAYNDSLLSQDLPASGQTARWRRIHPQMVSPGSATPRDSWAYRLPRSPPRQQPQRQIVAQQIDQHTQGAPVARRAYTDADFANLAHDDSHNVGLLDRFMGWIGSTGPGKWAGDIASDAQQAFDRSASSALKGLSGLSQTLDRHLPYQPLP
jgi:hypothetical protein